MNQTPNIVTKSQQAQAIENFHLTEQLSRLSQKWTDFKNQFYSSETYKQYIETKELLRRQVFEPIQSASKNTYNELPPQATRMKFNLLEKFTYNQRFIFLNFLALGSAVLSMRKINQFNVWTLGSKSLRNAALTYLLGGIMIAPEIYNPVLTKFKEISKN